MTSLFISVRVPMPPGISSTSKAGASAKEWSTSDPHALRAAHHSALLRDQHDLQIGRRPSLLCVSLGLRLGDFPRHREDLEGSDPVELLGAIEEDEPDRDRLPRGCVLHRCDLLLPVTPCGRDPGS